MIQQEYKTNIADMSGDITSTGFTIEANASVYAMLTQNVYNDPILAVVREWSTNACDACLAAGVPVKYDVHLPTPAEPSFYVRDYGTGLHPEDIIGLFSNLGASTKRNSNLYNGTLGIGRMAGLAVADSFSIESYYEGTLYSYVISMQDGIPVTLHLGDKATTEPNGLKLSVAVENRSFNYYVEKANAIYKYFDYKPDINVDTVEMELNTEERISEDWFIQESTGAYSYNYDNYVVMSQVVYTIPRNSELEMHDFRRLVLRAPSGSVTFNPGRESLTLDRKTVAYINKAFNQVKEDYVTQSVTALAACETDEELVRCFINTTKDAPRKIAQQIDPKPFMSQELQNLIGPTGTYGGNSINIHKTDAFMVDTSKLLQLSIKPSYYKTARELDRCNSSNISEFFRAKHVIIDLKTKYKTALNHHFKDELAVFWQRVKGEDLDLAVIEAKRYLTTLDIPYQLASTIVDTTSVSNNAFLPRQGLYASTIGNYGKVYKSEAMSAEDTTENTYLYLPLMHTTPIIKDSNITFRDYLTLHGYLQRNGTVPVIKGVAKKYQKYVENLDNWLDFETYIKDEVAKHTYRAHTGVMKGSRPSRWGDDDFIDYPQTIRHFCYNIQQYKTFYNSANHVVDAHLKNLLTNMGATEEAFTPFYPVTTATIQETYPLTYKLLFRDSYSFENSQYSTDEAKKLATIEEFYAVHSTDE